MLKLSRTNLVSRAIKVRLPTENPHAFAEGEITYKAKIKTKDELAALSEAGLTDGDYINELLVDVNGLGDAEGVAIAGDAALTEVRTGTFSSYLQAAILQDYFEQYADARVKNSKTSRGR